MFIIQFNDPESSLDYEIVSQKPFDDIIDSSKMNDIFKEKPGQNQIIGVFSNGKFESNVSPMLVLLSGLDNHLEYDLKIKVPNKKKFVKTSTVALFKNVKSIEHWPYPIEEIVFGDFRKLAAVNKSFTFEEKIDSTCINNPMKNIKAGEREFKSHLETVIDKFSQKEFMLDTALTYEQSIGAEDKSLGHYWSLSEGIYPNEKGFKFGDPISYRRIECPYFEARINYFFTKEKKEIKVVSFNWETFKESNFGRSDEIKDDVNRKFDEKFEFVINTVTSLLGPPIENIAEGTRRKLMRWKNNNGVNAYIFNFDDYNEINLYIYNE